MNSLYFECNAGISGDMAVAAMLDAGADEAVLMDALRSIPADGFTVKISRVKKSGIDCADFNVVLDAAHENHDHDMEYLFGHEHHHDEAEHEHNHNHDEEHAHPHGADGHHHEEHSGGEPHAHHEAEHVHHEEETATHHHGQHDETNPHEQHGEHHHHEHRGMAEITASIDGTQMTDGARALAKQIFGIIAQAESKAHGLPAWQVHFHEVGALDSIVDVIALAVCFDNLRGKYGIEKVYVPQLCEGRGTVRCQHGILSVPVPAVLNIVKAHKIALSFIEEQGEFVTPTGAAFAAAVMTGSSLPERFSVLEIGLGAGKRNYRRPSILRAFVIEENGGKSAIPHDTVMKLEANIDDCTGEALGFASELLMKSGALDVHFTPCFMKKNRPAYLLTVICPEEKTAELEKIIFLNTTTIGIRRSKMERSILPRKIITVKTELGDAQVKAVDVSGEKKFYPEYESVRVLCLENGCDFASAYREVLAAAKSVDSKKQTQEFQ